jgi:hypothetical protein
MRRPPSPDIGCLSMKTISTLILGEKRINR